MKLLKYLINFLQPSFGGGGSTQTVTEKNIDPWSGVQPYMKDIFRQAQNNYNTPNEFYPGQTYADFSPQTEAGLGMMESTALNNNIDQYAGQEAVNTLSGSYLGANPYIDRVVNDVTGDIGSQVASNFAQGGRFGSGAFMDTLSDSVGDAAAGIRYRNYNDERQNMQRALALAPQTQQLQYADPAQLMAVGNTYENQAQKGINEDMSRFNFYQNRDEQALANYNAMIQGGLSGFGNSTGSSTAPTSGGSPLMGALGGGLTGYGLASSIGALNPYTAPIAIGGALLGGLGLFD